MVFGVKKMCFVLTQNPIASTMSSCPEASGVEGRLYNKKSSTPEATGVEGLTQSTIARTLFNFRLQENQKYLRQVLPKEATATVV
jgi:hypothetical protein